MKFIMIVDQRVAMPLATTTRKPLCASKCANLDASDVPVLLEAQVANAL